MPAIDKLVTAVLALYLKTVTNGNNLILFFHVFPLYIIVLYIISYEKNKSQSFLFGLDILKDFAKYFTKKKEY